MSDTTPHGAATPSNEKAAAPKRPSRNSLEEKSMNGPLYRQGDNNVLIVRRTVKRKNESAMKQLARWFVDNQIGFSFNLLALLFLSHLCMPKAQPYTRRFFTFAYYNPDTGKYGLGAQDAYLMLFLFVLFTGLRAAAMEYVFAPFAKWQGLTKRKAMTRFSEQAWLIVYYVVFWCMGWHLYRTSPYYLNLRELWTSWPDRETDGLMKFYMLAQLSFWFHSVIVIHLEERRKDHWQMLTHHFITIALIFGCYRYHHTRVGTLILVLMDIVDLFFPTAKCLKYTGYNTLCDIMFGLFMVSWFFARHVAYMMVCYSVWAHTPNILPTGCFKGTNKNLTGPFPPPKDRGVTYLLEPLWDNEGLVCYNETVKWSFLSLLLFLQCITIAWFMQIIQVAARVIRGQGADDVRSDDEEEEEEEEEIDDYEAESGMAAEYMEAQRPLEQDVGADEIDFKNWERRTGVKRQHTTASGVSLPGHSDRKELLGRIGCEKQVE